MRILILTTRLPYPPNRGDRLRVFNFIKQLAREHTLYLVSFIAQDTEREHVDVLRQYCREVHLVNLAYTQSVWRVLTNLWRSEPLQVLYYRSAEMQRLVDKLLAEHAFDVVYVHLFRMAPYVTSRSDLYRVIDLTDVISEEIKRSLQYRNWLWRLIYQLELKRIKQYEQHTAQTFEETWLIAKRDREVLAQIAPEANIQIVTNGVDKQRFFPMNIPPISMRLLLVGHMGVFHNIDAAVFLVQEILPLVQRVLPACTLEIAGADPSPAVQALAVHQGVTVSGFVPDLNLCLNQAALFVAPLRFAAGVQNKVLEAMATGCPVVTTPIVNAGLGAIADYHLCVADDAVQSAEKIVTLLQHEFLRRSLGAAGLSFVHQNYSWQYVLDRVRSLEPLL